MTHLLTPDGVHLRYSDRGSGDPPIVLVHGWKGSHRLWDNVVVRLAPRHRVVAFDLRGMGESDKPRCDYDFDTLSDDLGAVVSALALHEPVLVGWSMGTTVVLRYLERGGAATGVVIVNGPLRLTATDDFPHAMTEQELNGHLRHLREAWPAGERDFQAQTVLDDSPALVDWLYSIALQTPLDVALAVVHEQAKLDMRQALASLDMPVLATYATADPYYPASLADAIAGLARHGSQEIFERSAHCIPIEEPDRFSSLVSEFAIAAHARRG
ncbi:MAG: alpha/beta fold hydrolase [Solirubrobacteraceae bacterium]